MPDILFLVVLPDCGVRYHCHNVSELFRLGELFGCDDSNSEVYRYTNSNTQFDLYAKWDADEFAWTISPEGVGFERINFKSLETGWRMLCRMKKT